MKTLRVTLADLEGIPHATAAAATAVTVTAAYTGPVILTDGTIIPTAIKAKTVGSSGVVNFSVHAADDPAVRSDHRGFAITVTAQIRLANGSVTAFKRTVKPLESMSSTIQLGTLTEAEGLPPQWVSVADFVDAIEAQVGEAVGDATAALDAAQAAQSSASSAASSAADAVTLAQQAQAAALEVPDANVSALIGNPATDTGALARMWPRYVPGGQSGGQQGADGPNSVGGYAGNVIADDVSGCSIAGGGTATGSGPGYANVIGKGIPANIGTGLPNYDHNDLPAALRGTTANQSFILGGYDNLASGLASMLATQHGYIAEDATHGALFGGSYNKILGGDYSFIGGGTQTTVESGLSQIAFGRNLLMKGSGYNFATGINSTVDGQSSAAIGSSHTVDGSTSTAMGASSSITGTASTALGRGHVITHHDATAVGREHNVSAGGGTAMGRFNTVSGTSGTAVGEYATASGTQSAAMGLRVTASGIYSLATGVDSVASVQAQHAHSAGCFATAGDAQTSRIPIRRQTTDATATSITISGGGSMAQHLQPSSANAFEGRVIAYEPATGETKAWRFHGLIRQGATGTATLIGTPTVTELGASAGAGAWGLTISSATRQLIVRGAGEAGKTIRWSGLIDITEVAA